MVMAEAAQAIEPAAKSVREGVPDGYKLTEVGAIPNDWTCEPLGPHIAITSGESPSLFRFGPDGIPYFKVEQLNNDSKYLSETPYYIRGGKTVPAGSIIFSKRGAAILLNRVRILKEPSFMDTNLMALTPRDTIYNEFLHYALIGIKLWRIADTTSIPQINNKHINPLLLPLPPTVAEQRKIAEALSDQDEALTALERLINKKHSIKDGVMQELLSERRRLPGFEEDWDSRSFAEIFDFYPTATNSRADLDESGDTYYIHYGDIHTQFHSHLSFQHKQPPKIARHKCRNAAYVRTGDWIMADASEDFDGVCKSIEILGLSETDRVVSGLHTFLLREKVPTFVPGFKGHLGNLKSLRDQYLRVMTGMKVFGVSKAALRDLTLPIPQPEEQDAIVSILSDMDAEIARLEGKLAKTKLLKQAMMQELLTGRVRLI